MADSPEPKYVHEHLAGVLHRLRRLQKHTRLTFPGTVGERAKHFFTLKPEPVPEDATYGMQVMVYPQDPFIGEAEIRHMNAADIQPGLINDRVMITDSDGPAAQPDEQGNYLYPPGSIEFDQINAFYYTTMTLRMYERYAQRALPWAFPAERLMVDPHAGSESNAFYNEYEQRLGFQLFEPEVGSPLISTARSADVVSHEAAHAVLDGVRDYYNESFGLGPAAFHESFGDMTAMLVALHDDSLLRHVLLWTKNDLRIENFIAVIGEQLSNSLMNRGTDSYDHTAYLRNAINTLTASPFDDLMYRPADPVRTLGRQSHNYSRLFTGAFYDALVEVYDRFRVDKIHPHIALSRARDVMGKLLITAVECGPVGEMDFSDMAKAFIAADQLLYQGKYAAKLGRVFEQRGIVTAADLEAFRTSLLNLPRLMLPDEMDTPAASMAFLKDQVIPALNLPGDVEFVPMASYRNALGFGFVTYAIETVLDFERNPFLTYSVLKLKAYGGLSLAFSPENRLVSAIYRPVTAEDTRQIQIMIDDLIREGLIVPVLSQMGDLLESAPVWMEDHAALTAQSALVAQAAQAAQIDLAQAAGQEPEDLIPDGQANEVPQGVVMREPADGSQADHQQDGGQPDETSDLQLLRLPVMVDPLPSVKGFREYLRHLNADK